MGSGLLWLAALAAASGTHRDHPTPELARQSRFAAGVRATFRTDAAWLRLDLHACEADGHTVDVLVEGALAARVPVSVGDNRVRAPMPAGVKAVEVWLPH